MKGVDGYKGSYPKDTESYLVVVQRMSMTLKKKIKYINQKFGLICLIWDQNILMNIMQPA